MAVALAVSALVADPSAPTATRPLAAVLGVAMGRRSATRVLAVSDVPTNVVTATVTKIGVGLRGAERPRQRRGASGVAAMFAGADQSPRVVGHAPGAVTAAARD